MSMFLIYDATRYTHAILIHKYYSISSLFLAFYYMILLLKMFIPYMYMYIYLYIS